MTELVHILGPLANALGLIVELIRDIALPMAGIGGGVEVKESVDVVAMVKDVAMFALVLAGIFGVGLAVAAQRFAVKIDPRIDEVKGVLAGAHCGACGFPGCEQYAEAVVTNPDVAPNLCTPGGSRTLEAVARITGKSAAKADPLFARIMCQGGLSRSRRRYVYEGVADCRAAVLAGGGDKSCLYGCLGYGTCASVCPFNAIEMNAEMLPVVNIARCTGCRKCEKACPKQVIEVLQGSKAVLVACHSKDKGAETKRHCDVGCIGCGKCVKVCPYDAAAMGNKGPVALSRIDPAKCQVCGLCVKHCPTSAIADLLPKRPKAFISGRCNGCGKCVKVCPVDAISGERKKLHLVNQSACTGCGICTANCPVQAIEGTFNTAAVMEAAARGKAAKALGAAGQTGA